MKGCKCPSRVSKEQHFIVREALKRRFSSKGMPVKPTNFLLTVRKAVNHNESARVISSRKASCESRYASVGSYYDTVSNEEPKTRITKAIVARKGAWRPGKPKKSASIEASVVFNKKPIQIV